MIDLPPSIVLPDPPAIIRTLEHGLWIDIDRKMQRLGLNRDVRRSVIAEMRKAVGGKPALVKATAHEMARYGGDPVLGSMLINAFLGASAPAMVYSYEGATGDSANSGTYTFTNKNVGAAAAGRLVLAGIATSGGTPRTVTGVTAGGVAMTKGPESVGNSTGWGSATWFYLTIAAGTTSTFVVTLNGTALDCTIEIYRLFPVSSTPLDTATLGVGGGPPKTLTDLEVKTSGLALILSTTTSNMTAYSWGGVDTPIVDDANNGTWGHPVNALSIPTTENDTTRDFTMTNGSAVQAVGISFQ
ncbi:hypothetical protein LJR234_000375 [Mesorhizobium amorphae]|uniref:hypothetical protein n=1 Tax=Mesorhizobium amorphae TaxID=71433 RepID=UPI003ECC8A35